MRRPRGESAPYQPAPAGPVPWIQPTAVRVRVLTRAELRTAHRLARWCAGAWYLFWVLCAAAVLWLAR